MWLAVPIALFLLFAYVGRLVRLGRLKSGPWFHQFRTVRSLISMGLLVTGIGLAVRGAWPAGLAFIVISLLLGGSVRFSGSFGSGPQQPQTAASYSSEEIRAYQTLGLSIGADRKAVKDAWKRLMKTAHPDQGGDAARASALNAARDVLLRRR